MGGGNADCKKQKSTGHNGAFISTADNYSPLTEESFNLVGCGACLARNAVYPSKRFDGSVLAADILARHTPHLFVLKRFFGQKEYSARRYRTRLHDIVN